MKKLLLLCIALLLNMNAAQAVLRVEITKGAEGAAPIAVIPFERKGLAVSAPVDVSAIIAADLQRSGKFAPVEQSKLIARPQSLESVNYKLWRLASIDHIVIGQVTVLAPKQYELQFRLIDVFKGGQVLGYQFKADDSSIRGIAHHISDLIYEQITGQKGAFDTKIAYVTVERKIGKQPAYKLEVDHVAVLVAGRNTSCICFLRRSSVGNFYPEFAEPATAESVFVSRYQWCAGMVTRWHQAGYGPVP